MDGAWIVAAAYLLGSVPFGLLLGWLAGVDVRKAGSGNIGATNVARTAGKPLGILTLVLDAAKGAAPPLFAAGLGLAAEAQLAAGLAAVIGHVFPVYLGFRGGKGVATAAGAFVALTPVPALIAVGTFGFVFAVMRVVSLGSLAGSLALVAAGVWLDGRGPVIAAAVAVTVLIFVRHTGNIRRMWRGGEPRV